MLGWVGGIVTVIVLLLTWGDDKLTWVGQPFVSHPFFPPLTSPDMAGQSGACQMPKQMPYDFRRAYPEDPRKFPIVNYSFEPAE